MEEKKLPVSRMSMPQTILVLCWLPIHVLGLPLLLFRLFPQLDSAGLNFADYVIGALVLTLGCLSFLRRDFDRLWERPLFILGQALLGYGLMFLADYLFSVLLGPFLPAENPNNASLEELARQDQGRIAAMSVILAPLTEELIFRGGVFGLLRRWSRIAAYAGCVLLFGAYHTWQYALVSPVYWLFLLQYLPAGLLLCYSYEKTECIWTPILFHILNNALALWAMDLLGG